MQRLDVFNWKEVENGERFQGRMHLRASGQVAAFLEVEGFEVLAGYGSEIEVTFEGTGVLRIEAPKGVKVFAYCKTRQGLESKGEIFTNIDRKPHESAAMLEVKRALRLFEVQKRKSLNELRAIEEEAKAARKAAKQARKAAEAEVEEAVAEAASQALEASPDGPVAD